MKCGRTRCIGWVIIFLVLLTLTCGNVTAESRAYQHRIDRKEKGIAGNAAVSLKLKVTYDQTDARSMLKLINDFRTGEEAWYYKSDGSKTYVKDLKKLTYDYTLEKAAKQRAAEIALFFSHTRPNGSNCFTALKGNYGYTGENICLGYKDAKTAFIALQETDDDYAGQGHRRVMLNKNYNAVGIAKVKYNGYFFYVQEFGYTDKPDTSKTEADDAAKKVTIKVDTEVDEVRVSNVETSVKKIKLGIEMKSALPSKATAMITFENAWRDNDVSVSQKITWSTTSDCVRIVDGELIGVKAGTATLTAKAFGKKLKIKVTVLSTPKISNISVTKDKAVKIKWKAVDGASRYRILRKTKGSKWKELDDTTDLSYLDINVKENKTYYYTIRCVSQDGETFISNYDPAGKKIEVE